jgi:hypothetical protein
MPIGHRSPTGPSVVRHAPFVAPRPPGTIGCVADEFDPQAMVERFRARAQAVRSRGLPPVEGPEREQFKRQAQADYMDFAMVGDATPSLEEGILTLRIDLRPADADGD